MSVSLSEKEREELRKFLLQENSQEILDNLKIIPDGDDLLLAYLKLRVTATELKENLDNINILQKPQKYLEELTRYKKMKKSIKEVEDLLAKPPTILQSIKAFSGRLIGSPFEGGLEVLRDIIIAQRNKSKSNSDKKPLTKRYIWRTQQDSDVRPDHAAREGQVFWYSQPPKGGNPGKDYGCRCWAEPLSDDWTSGLGEIFKR